MTFCSSSKVAVFSLLTIDVDLCLNMSEDLNQIYCRRSLDMNLNIVDISRSQGMLWNIFLQPLGCFVFFVSLMADMGRLPFDQNESEEELIAGWITEYCGMRFGLGFFAEYIHMILG